MNVLARMCFLCSLTAWAQAAAIPPEWSYGQDIQVSQKGIVRVKLPLETLSNAQPARGDLRLMDPAGQEISYLVDQPMAEQARQVPLSGMKIAMTKGKTVITGQVPQTLKNAGFDTLSIYTATDDFLKPITIETSRDQIHWVTSVNAYPFFKQPGEPLSTAIEFPKTSAPFLRITLDDATTPPIRVQAVQLYAGPKKLANLETITPAILEVLNDAHQTEVHLLLPADNLTIDTLRLETPEGTFRRKVSVSGKTFSNGEFRESVLGQGTVYRVALNQKLARQDAFYLGQQVPGRQLILRIENADSRPLTITRVTAEVVPAYLTFDAPVAGSYALWVGNLLAAPKNYDVAGLRDTLARAAFSTGVLGPLMKNPAYRVPEPLPQVNGLGTEIDISSWRFRKKLVLAQPGVQRLEPDLQVLSHNAGRWAALRIVQEGKQIPYVMDRVGAAREINVQIEEKPAKGSLSQWTLAFPEPGLPVSSLRCKVADPLFQRSLILYETLLDERGETRRQVVGQGAWVRVNNQGTDAFTLTLYHPVQSQTLVLETDNRDNPPIHLSKMRAFYQTPRILFKASPGKDLYLYYGNDDVSAPQYDLDLVAAELLATPPTEAALGSEERLKVSSWWEVPLQAAGGMKYIFWIVMGLVVIGLLMVIAKLLPAENSTHGS